MSEVLGDTARPTADMVQALRFIRARPFVQAALRGLIQQNATGLTMRELSQFARRRGYSAPRKPTVSTRVIGYTRHSETMRRAVALGLVNAILVPKPMGVKGAASKLFIITSYGREALRLFDTIDLSDI